MSRRRSRTLLLTGSVLGAGLVAPTAAVAHGLVGKSDLPIPRWLFAWAAAVVLVVSFVALAALWPKPRLERLRERPLARFPRLFDPLLGAAGMALFAVVIYAGYAGSQQPTANLVPTFVYVLFWVGLVFASLLFGDVFRAVNPWRAFARGASWVGRRVGAERVWRTRRYPERFGRWPAAVGIAAFAWLELVLDPSQKDSPSTLATLALVYAAIQLVGMALYGIEAWTEQGDA